MMQSFNMYYNSILLFYTLHETFISAALTNDQTPDNVELSVCRRIIKQYGDGVAVWNGSSCQCINCAPSGVSSDCSKPDCNGAPLMRVKPYDLEIPKCDVSRCPVARSGECCATTTCLNEGVMDQKGACDYNGTNYIGQFCEKTCQNGGTKKEGLNSCTCPVDFEGSACEVPKCYNNFRARGGKCLCDEIFGPGINFGKFCQKMECEFGSIEIRSDDRTVWCDCWPFFRGITCGIPETFQMVAIGLGAIASVLTLVVAFIIWKRGCGTKNSVANDTELQAKPAQEAKDPDTEAS